MPLSPLQVKNAKQGRHADGKGLYLLVSPSGSKSWVLRVQVDGRRRDFGLGSTDIISLADARQKAGEWRKIAKEGLDPSQEAKRQRGLRTTFEEAARTYFAERQGHGKSRKHDKQWITTLETYAFPIIGRMSVDRIDAIDIQQVLLPIWQTKAKTARRVRQRIATVLDNCKAKGLRQTEAPMRAVSTLMKGIKQPKGFNFAAMPYRDVPAFMSKLDKIKPTMGRLALQFCILTAARSGEVRGARRQELDLQRGLWTIPAERMKAGAEHVVPLSAAAKAVLGQALEHSPDEPTALVFPGLRRKPLSDMTLAKALKANGGADYTVHGFRSSFRDWAAEKGVPHDWAESALAHTVQNKVEAAYRRTRFVEQRVGLMADWAEFCLSSKAEG